MKLAEQILKKININEAKMQSVDTKFIKKYLNALVDNDQANGEEVLENLFEKEGYYLEDMDGDDIEKFRDDFISKLNKFLK